MGGVAPGAFGGMGGGPALLGGGGLAPQMPVIPHPAPIDVGGATLSTPPVIQAPAIDPVSVPAPVQSPTAQTADLAQMLQRAQDMQRMLPAAIAPSPAGATSDRVAAYLQNRADPEAMAALADVARRQGVDPLAMAGVIKTESNWNPRNQTGSYNGLTQIGPKTFQEAGGKLGGLTYDQFKAATPAQQIGVYDAWLNHYGFQNQLKQLGIDPSTLPVERQAALLQGFQFSPNGMKFKDALAQGRTDVPATHTAQARALGDTSIGNMERYFKSQFGGVPAQSAPPSAPAFAGSPPPAAQFPQVAQSGFAGSQVAPPQTDGVAIAATPPVDRMQFTGSMDVPQAQTALSQALVSRFANPAMAQAQMPPGAAPRPHPLAVRQVPTQSIPVDTVPAVPPNGSQYAGAFDANRIKREYDVDLNKPITPINPNSGVKGSDVMASWLQQPSVPSSGQGRVVEGGAPPVPALDASPSRKDPPNQFTKFMNTFVDMAAKNGQSSGRVDENGNRVETPKKDDGLNWKAAGRMMALGFKPTPITLPPMSDIPGEVRRTPPVPEYGRKRRFRSAFPINEG